MGTSPKFFRQVMRMPTTTSETFCKAKWVVLNAFKLADGVCVVKARFIECTSATDHYPIYTGEWDVYAGVPNGHGILKYGLYAIHDGLWVKGVFLPFRK